MFGLRRKKKAKDSKDSVVSKLRARLSKTRDSLSQTLSDLIRGKQSVDEDLLEQVETQLLLADVGVDATKMIVDDLYQKLKRNELQNPELLYSTLKSDLANILAPCSIPLELPEQTKPYIILMVGVNGAGKTTTIGKLARRLQSQGKSVMLAAGDTFRAAAIEQLQSWGRRLGAPVVAQNIGADSASVIFDACESAKAKGIDVLIADTAGRLQTKSNLMEELAKVKRVISKSIPDAPHEVMLVLDSGTGQNAISQAKQFDEAVGLTGITLTKLDGTAKGGIIFAVANQFKIPIRFIGVGEDVEDLRPFNSDNFIAALFDDAA
ncbi:MAG TPA: signal recognition particle-docking protein FtsY [Gammaproteobacteria bacterium]|nr:signal recognition particle-docking protein FtsY [Gammaproteobacteria bacterium]